MSLILKKCSLNDLEVLISISRITFIDAFKKDNNPDDFKEYLETAFSEVAIKSQLNNPNSFFYFIYNNNDLLGYVKLNEEEAQNEQFESASIELERIYILQKFQGKNYGAKALLKILEIAKKRKVNFLWLGVWERNHAAIRFYERHRFKKFGEHPYMLGSDEQTDWLMKYDFS